MSKFNESDFDFAPAWRPLSADIIQGVVTERSTRETEYGEYPILSVQAEEPARVKGDLGEFEYVTGEITIHGIHTALKNQIEDRNPQVGDYVGVLFGGKVERPDAEDFFSYRLKVDRKTVQETELVTAPDGPDGSVSNNSAPDDTDLPF